MIGQSALVVIGGACGALARYWIGSTLAAWFGREFPWGTLTVNVVGSFVIGLLFVVLIERTPTAAEAWRALLVVGFLGGLTTFSAFSIETVTLLQSGQMLRAFANVSTNLLLGFGACWLGLTLARV